MSWDEWSWAVGILEGEGAFWATKRANRRLLAVQIKVSMTDEDTVQRLRSAIGYGAVYGPYQDAKRPRTKPYWEYRVVRYQEVSALVNRLYPHMSQRRQDQLSSIRRTLDAPGRRWYKQQLAAGAFDAGMTGGVEP